MSVLTVGYDDGCRDEKLGEISSDEGRQAGMECAPVGSFGYGTAAPTGTTLRDGIGDIDVVSEHDVEYETARARSETSTIDRPYYPIALLASTFFN